MIKELNYKVDLTLIQNIVDSFDLMKDKVVLNFPVGDFFTDPWKLKDEYKDTIYQDLYDSLPLDKGEARIINLPYKDCYHAHSDIDDRYHLTLQGKFSYLINLDEEKMYPTYVTGIWNVMNAGCKHSAVNFSNENRLEFVVRKLLKKNKLESPIYVTLRSTDLHENTARYVFDNVISPWLNKKFKEGVVDKFSYSDKNVSFYIEENIVTSLYDILPKFFDINISSKEK